MRTFGRFTAFSRRNLFFEDAEAGTMFSFLALIVFLVSTPMAIFAFTKQRARLGSVAAAVAFVALCCSLPMFVSTGNDTTSDAFLAVQPSGNPSTPTDQSTPQPTDAPATPTPDRHDERQPYQDFWNRIVSNMALAQVSIHYAANAIDQGNAVEASRILGYGETYAQKATDDTTSDVPDQWQTGTVGASLNTGASDMAAAIAKARSYLDSQKPSDLADAQDTAEQAKTEIDEATHDARVSYQAMGGKGADLESMDDAVADMTKTFDALLGSGSSQ
jgi:hypothetical protein